MPPRGNKQSISGGFMSGAQNAASQALSGTGHPGGHGMGDYATVLQPEHLDFLRRVCPGDVLFTPEEIYPYGTDASMKRGTPLAVVRPSTVEQASKIMHWANDIRMPVYVRGRGTNLVGDCVPVLPGLVVSTTKMDRILEISREDFVAVVEPGVNTASFQAACEAQGLYYPPDPATVKASSIGGNVITCAGGMRALKYGVTRDFVLGMEVVLPGGDVVMFGGRNHKDVVGLDLARLMVGSEGTLGFVSKLWLKLLPKPEASASVLLGYDSYVSALGAVGDIFAAGILPCALEFIGEAIIDVMARNGEVPWPANVRSLLLLRLDGSNASLPQEIARVLANAPSALWHMKGVGAEEEEPLWEIRRRINPTTFILGPDKASDDVVVPRGLLVKAIGSIEKIAREHDITVVTYGHVGDGNIHINILYDAKNEDLKHRVHAGRLAMEKAVLQMGGTISGEHGCGISKDVGLQIPERERGLMRGIRAVFDPRGIMNPGKAY